MTLISHTKDAGGPAKIVCRTEPQRGALRDSRQPLSRALPATEDKGKVRLGGAYRLSLRSVSQR